MLWAESAPGLHRYLSAVAGDQADVLAVRTWAESVGKLRRFRGDEAAWRRLLFSTARACARQHVPEPRALPRVRADSTLGDAVTQVAVDLVAALPKPQAEVVILRTAGRLSAADVARVLNLSVPTVRAAAHAGLARAGALADDRAARGRIDRAQPVQDPPGWERTGFVAGLGAVESAVDDLLSGRSVGPGAPRRAQLLASLLVALTAPASTAELAGAEAALAAFREAMARPEPGRRGLQYLGSRAAVAVAAASIGVFGSAAAAYAGLLPAPAQDIAHDWFGAPAGSSGGHGRGSAPGSAAASVTSTAVGGSGSVPGNQRVTARAGRPPVPGVTSGAPVGESSTGAGAVPTSAAAPPVADDAGSRPGSTRTPPGSTRTPPGSTRTPPGSTRTPPGSTRTPPGSTRTPPGSTRTPPGSTRTPPGSTKTPPGSTKTPPGSTKTPPGGGAGAQSR